MFSFQDINMLLCEVIIPDEHKLQKNKVQNWKIGRGKRHWVDRFALTWFLNGQQFLQMYYPIFVYKAKKCQAAFRKE